MRPSEGPGSIEAPVRAFSYESGASGPGFTRAVAVEAPVQIVIGGAPFAIMMATPRDLEDFACGFALTEQIAETVKDIRGIEVERVVPPDVLADQDDCPVPSAPRRGVGGVRRLIEGLQRLEFRQCRANCAGRDRRLPIERPGG